MLAAKDTVHKLIPQGPPMVMVDTLIYQDEHNTRTGFYLENDNLFNEDGYFSEEGLIENIAQSAALRTGWTALQKHGRDGEVNPPVGVIGSVKNFKLYRKPMINSSITTEITVQAEVFNATLISGKVMQDNEVLAEAELKIFIQDQQA
jgi:3-hydroxymyristoyl/3-hydroxydecanoyl-(acyl carrier protein) dehydratase